MPTIYKRIAVCSDTTWNALDAAEQAEYDEHYNSWDGWLNETNKDDLAALNLGCCECIVWDDFGVLSRYEVTSTTRAWDNVDNYMIYRAHPSARGNGTPGSGIKMHGVFHYYLDYVLFDGFEFDQAVYPNPSDNYYISCVDNWFYFENCIFSNIATMYYSQNAGYYKNCLFYNLGAYIRNAGNSALMLNCGIHSATKSQRLVSNTICYNCWTYSDVCDYSRTQFDTTCTGDNNYAQDGSGPITKRTLTTFGFTDPANGDFSITSASPLFDSGTTTGKETKTDIAGNPRSAGDKLDIGPFEVVAQTQLVLKGVVIGSAISVVDLDDGGFIVEPFVADEATEVMEFMLDTATNVAVRVRNASGAIKYIPWASHFLLTSAGATLYVNQVEDKIAQ